jgi:hypothetical protein
MLLSGCRMCLIAGRGEEFETKKHVGCLHSEGVWVMSRLLSCKNQKESIGRGHQAFLDQNNQKLFKSRYLIACSGAPIVFITACCKKWSILQPATVVFMESSLTSSFLIINNYALVLTHVFVILHHHYNPLKVSSNAVKPPTPITAPTALLVLWLFLFFSDEYLLRDLDRCLLDRSLPALSESEVVRSLSSYLPLDEGVM